MAKRSWLINLIYVQAREFGKLNKQAKNQTINRITPREAGFYPFSLTSLLLPKWALGTIDNLPCWFLICSCLSVLSRWSSVSVPCRALIKIREAIATKQFSKTLPWFPWLQGFMHRHTEPLMQELLLPSDYCHCDAFSTAPL